MLNNVPTAMRKAGRQMVRRHPNAMDAEVYRKQVTRTVGAESGDLGGLPTLGGMAVLDSEEEAQIDYVPIGTGKVLFGGIYEKTEMVDQRDAAEPQVATEGMFEPDVEGAFELKESDLIMATPGAGVVIPYEVTAVLNTVNIPPYLPKYMLAPQGDLPFDADIAANLDARP